MDCLQHALPARTGLLAVALLAASCGGDDPRAGAAELVDDGASVVVANSPGTLTTNGPQRVLVALLGDGPNDVLGGADLPATIEFRSPSGETDEIAGEWLSTPGSPLGMYRTSYTFAEPGSWEVRVLGNEEQPGFAVEVGEDSAVPEAGDLAPHSVTPTAADATELSEISTDPDPVARFYQQSVDEAVTSGQPSVVVFATPAFCRTATCGPTMELVRDVAADHPEVSFVHVEPFEIEAARAGELIPVEMLSEWGLATEPWVFVVDGDGVVAASFEGLIGSDELRRALDGL